jgi:elongator complex protein 5
MAESISRALRDGASEGEHAPALTIKDSIASPFGFHVFTHLLTQLSSNVLAGKSQSRSVSILN